MARKPELFDACWISIKGRLLEYQTQVEVRAVDQDEQVDLLSGNGEFPPTANLPGARRLMVSWTMVVPTDSSGDLELWDLYESSERFDLALQLVGNKRKLSTRGVMREPSMKSQVNDTTSYDISAMCDFAVWKG